MLRDEGTEFLDQDGNLQNNHDTLSSSSVQANKNKLGKKKMYSKIGREVEKWAQSLLDCRT
jgi:hypothetical protein